METLPGRAYRRLENKLCWSRYSWFGAVDVFGNFVPATSPKAVAWDILGAIDASYEHRLDKKFWWKTVREYCLENYDSYASDVNWTMGHEAVLEVLRACRA